jgi:hypothetical protein
MREFKRERRGKIEKQRKRKLEQRENILHWRFSAKHLQRTYKKLSAVKDNQRRITTQTQSTRKSHTLILDFGCWSNATFFALLVGALLA